MSLPDTSTPFIPRGVRVHFDKVRETWVLLAPERTITLDPIGHAILNELDGTRSFGTIVATLAAKYDAPAEAIRIDAAEFITTLMDRRILEVRT